MTDLERMSGADLEVHHALAVTASVHAQSDAQRDEAARLIRRIEAEYRRREALQSKA